MAEGRTECTAVGRQRQSFDNRLGFFNRFGVHKEDHATGLILAKPELVDLAVEMGLAEEMSGGGSAPLKLAVGGERSSATLAKPCARSGPTRLPVHRNYAELLRSHRRPIDQCIEPYWGETDLERPRLDQFSSAATSTCRTQKFT